MEFRILGPVQVVGDDGPLRCTGRPLHLLALLAMARGRIVPADAATDALWGDRLPAHPENSLQVVVSRLRRAIGDGAVARAANGYRLAAPAGAVDAERFEALARAGREAIARGEHADARAQLADALALWHGAALQDVRDEPFASAEAARLDDLRLDCLGARIDADLALGRGRELLAELQALVAAHPHRESFRGQLMLALYRSGRQADALRAFDDARRVLLDDLGLDPSEELHALQRAILRQEAGLPAARAGRREVVCLAVDLRVEAGGAPADPEILGDVIARCHAAAEAIARRHGHPLLELRGDGLTAVFGSPLAHEDDAVRAVRAGEALMAWLADLGRALGRERGIDLAAGAGLSAGPALVPGGAPAGTLPLGDVVTAAARAARAAEPGAIVVDERARALLAGRTGADADVPLVGREAELAVLSGAFDRVVRDRAPATVALVGEPGIGKSRLARELARRLAPAATVLHGRCPPYGDAITYWPVREMVVGAAGGQPLERLTAGLEDGDGVAAAIGATLGLRDGVPGEAAPWAFQRLFAALARERPLVLVFEDMHWADPGLLELVESLGTAAEPVPLLLLCVGRPELLAARPEWDARVVRPVALADRESEQLLAGRPGLAEDRRSAIVARAGGNPLFLEQLAAVAADGGDPGTMPPALRPLLAARLDLLAEADRALLDAAAVEGERFHLGGVLAVAGGGDPAGAARALDGLVERELLLAAQPDVPGERAWWFRHALVHEAAYESLPRAARADGHERLADWLEAHAAAVPEADARIGTQLERAHAAAAGLRPAGGLGERAARWLIAAATRAHRRGDLPDEISLLDRAGALLAGDPPAQAELLPQLAAALFEAGTLERAEAAAAEGVAAGERLGLPRVRWRSAVERERLRMFAHPDAVDPDAILAVAREAVAALGELGDDLGLARAHYLTCELLWLTGQSEEGARIAEEVIAHAERAGSPFEIDNGVSYLAYSLLVNAIPVPQALERCAQLERAVAGRFAALSVRGFRAVLDTMGGDADQARGELAAARRGLRELGLQQASVWMAANQALAETLAGDAAAAEQALLDAERIALDIGDRWFHSMILVDRAHSVLDQDDLAAAAAAVARIDEVPAPGDIEWRIRRHTAVARLSALRGEHARAADELRAAVALADGTQMVTLRADVYRDLAEVAARAGRHGDAAAAAAVALELYDAKGNRASAGRLRAAPWRSP